MAKKEPIAAAPALDTAKLYSLVKALEIKINNLNREFNLVKNDLMKRSSDTKKNIKNFDKELLDLRHKQEENIRKTDLIIKELKQTAGREEVQVLKKYIEFWNPVNFVTQKDLDRLFEQKKNDLIAEMKAKMKEKPQPKETKEKTHNHKDVPYG